MKDTLNRKFLPNWASPPGDTIIDILEEKAMSEEDFASAMDIDMEIANGLLHGEQRIRINRALAKKLSKVLGSNTQFWINRERIYRSDAKRLAAKKRGTRTWKDIFSLAAGGGIIVAFSLISLGFVIICIYSMFKMPRSLENRPTDNSSSSPSDYLPIMPIMPNPGQGGF